jgi:HK97 family phage major capsid protein
MTLQAGTDASGIIHPNFIEEVVTALVESSIMKHSLYIDASGSGRNTISVPYIDPSSLMPYLTAESAAFTPDQTPTFDKATISLTKFTVQVVVTNEFMADSIRGFLPSLRATLTDLLIESVESTAVALVNAVIRTTVAAGASPTYAEYAEAMAAVKSYGHRKAAWYVSPAHYVENMLPVAPAGSCCGNLPEGAIGSFAGYPVYPMPMMSSSGTGKVVAWFGDLSKSVAVATDLSGSGVRLLTEPKAVTDETIVQAKVRAGAAFLDNGTLHGVKLP